MIAWLYCKKVDCDYDGGTAQRKQFYYNGSAKRRSQWGMQRTLGVAELTKSVEFVCGFDWLWFGRLWRLLHRDTCNFNSLA